MNIEVCDLSGENLDWAVSKCEGTLRAPGTAALPYSSDKGLAARVIDRMGIKIYADDPVAPFKAIYQPDPNEPHYFFRQFGPTAEIAAMRVRVAVTLGSYVTLPAVISI